MASSPARRDWLSKCVGSESEMHVAGTASTSPRRPPRTWASCRPRRASTARSSTSRTRTERSSSATRCSRASACPRPAGGASSSTPDESTPDLLTFGKVVGGGMPVAALGGRAEIMEQLAPLGPVYQAGTLSGNPVAVSAGVTTLRLADAAVYAKLDEVSAVLQREVSRALAAEGVAHVVQRAGNLFSFMFGDAVAGGVRDYAGVQSQESWRYPPFFHAMLDAGVSLPPSVFEAWFVTAAHDDAAIGRILEALPGAARAAASARPPS